MQLPKLGSKTYGMFFEELLKSSPASQVIQNNLIEKRAEEIMLSAFSNELQKLANAGNILMGALKATAAGEFGSELVNRILHGKDAERSVGQIARDAATGMVFHLPFAYGSHYVAPGLSAIAKAAPEHSLKAISSGLGAGALNFMGGIGTPGMMFSMRAGLPLVDYATGTSPQQLAEKQKKKEQQIGPLEPEDLRLSTINRRTL